MRAIVACCLSVALLGGCANALYSTKGDVLMLTKDNFDKEVVKSNGVVFVEFFAPWCGHCKQLAPEWEKAAKALKGVVTIAAVDATADAELASQFGVQGYPTIKIFGASKKSPSEYQSGRTAKDIVTSALKEVEKLALQRLGGKVETGKQQQESHSNKKEGSSGGSDPTSDVIELTDDEFEKQVLGSKEPWLVEFYAPWCGHCKNLAPEWKKAATSLVGLVKVAAVDATAHRTYAGKYGVQGFPTIKFFAPGSSEPEDYQGGRTAEAITSYGMKKAELYPSAPPEIHQVLDNKQLKEDCLDAKMLCVVAVLPHVMNTGASGRNSYIDTLKQVAGKFRARSVAVMWFSEGESPKFEETFQLSLNAPTFVALHQKKSRYYNHRGKFDVKSISEAIDKLVTGRLATSEIKAFPELDKMAAWDGKDYVPPSDD